MPRKQLLLAVFALFLVCSLAPVLHAQEWVYLGGCVRDHNGQRSAVVLNLGFEV